MSNEFGRRSQFYENFISLADFYENYIYVIHGCATQKKENDKFYDIQIQKLVKEKSELEQKNSVLKEKI